MDDYAKMEGVPFVLEKLVVVDRKAASRGGGGYDDGEQSGLEAIFSLTQGGEGREGSGGHQFVKTLSSFWTWI